MKMRLMTFDEAYKALREAYPMSANLTNKSLLGIRRKSLPWGKKVEVDINTLSNGYIPTYALNGFLVPTCVFKADDANLNDVLRYGIIITDDELYKNAYCEESHLGVLLVEQDLLRAIACEFLGEL